MQTSSLLPTVLYQNSILLMTLKKSNYIYRPPMHKTVPSPKKYQI